MPQSRFIPAALLAVAAVAALRAADPAPPYPPSPVIAGLDWAPADTIIRRAKDGDNWPVTWADDDALYTTWGDGTGFDPEQPTAGHGLRGLRERLALAGGTCTITSALGRGTVVEAALPTGAAPGLPSAVRHPVAEVTR